MLNDLSRQIRMSTFAQTFGGGLMIGAALAVIWREGVLAVVLFGIGVVFQVVWAIVVAGWGRRSDRALRDQVVQGSDDLVSGTVTGVVATGRVVRRRIAGTYPAYVRSWSTAVPPPAAALVLELLTDDGVRRRAALVPVDIGLAARKAPVVVVLHPSLEEVAVLDDAPDPAILGGIAADPRWETSGLSDRQVVGGYLPVLGMAVLGFALGVAVDAVLVALLVL